MRLLVVFAVGALCQSGCVGCGPPLPASDRCEEPGQALLDSLEIGRGETDEFVPLVDGDVVAMTYGPQGGAMLGLHLRMRGQVPGCLAQRTEAFDDEGLVVASEGAPLMTYEGAGGVYTTGNMWLVLDWTVVEGQSVRIVAEAGGQQAERRVWVGHEGPDAGPDAGAADAGADAGADLDGGPADAAPADAAWGGDGGPADAAPADAAWGADGG